MGAFDSKNYSIKEKLPEWWKQDNFLTPINNYTQELVINMVGSLLNNLGVAQPFNVWKWLPIEYNWTHNYFSSDEYLEGRDTVLSPDYTTIALMPNTKRNCNAIIKLSLNGNNLQQQEFVNITLTNGFQQIKFKNINNTSTIEIFTETNDILIDGVMNSDLFDGSFDKIQPVAKNPNFEESYIDDNGDIQYKHIDISDENKITKLEIQSDSEVYFDLYVELINPVYVTEQHIRLATVSSFPLEWVKLYGFYCHDFNDQEGYQFLWEKKYEIDERVVYDRITKQFDCERFYIQVKLHGIGIPISYGFPQESTASSSSLINSGKYKDNKLYQLPEGSASSPTFAINERLDKWGKIYGLPRRIYRTDIEDDDEINTFPQFYKYSIEQDYWYEERLVNEYRYNDNAINGLFLKDTDSNNIALIESISPSMNDVWVFTETIIPEADINKETQDIYPCQVLENTDEDDYGVSWEKPQAIKNENIISEPIYLQKYNSDSLNDALYETKSLKVRFNLNDLNIPKNIKIKGIELKIKAETNIHSDALRLDPTRSVMLLNHVYTKDNGDIYTTQEKISIITESNPWKKGQLIYTIGGKNNLFGQEEITRNQLFQTIKENNTFTEKGYIDFIIAFQNINKYLDVSLLVHTISLKLYYELQQDKFNINMTLTDKEIVLSEQERSTNLQIDVENIGNTNIHNKKIFIATPPELEILNNKNEFNFELDIGESFTIGNGISIDENGHEFEDEDDIITIQPVNNRTGRYDIILFCDDKVLRDEIIVRKGFE